VTGVRYTQQVLTYGGLSCITLAGVVTTLWLFSVTGDDPAVLVGSLLIALFLLFCLFLFLIFLIAPRSMTRTLARTVYGITNQRVVVITRGKNGPVTRSHTSADFGPLERLERGAGWGDISYGRPRFTRAGGTQVRVIDQLNGIPHVREVEGLLLRVFKNAQPDVPAYWNQPQQVPLQAAASAQPEEA
jgi:hypothetical protein